MLRFSLPFLIPHFKTVSEISYGSFLREIVGGGLMGNLGSSEGSFRWAPLPKRRTALQCRPYKRKGPPAPALHFTSRTPPWCCWAMASSMPSNCSSLSAASSPLAPMTPGWLTGFSPSLKSRSLASARTRYDGGRKRKRSAFCPTLFRKGFDQPSNSPR